MQNSLGLILLWLVLALQFHFVTAFPMASVPHSHLVSQRLAGLKALCQNALAHMSGISTESKLYLVEWVLEQRDASH